MTPLMVAYLGGWMLITTAALTAPHTVPGSNRPPSLRGYTVTSLIAGAIWPVLLVGVAEFAALLTYAKLHRA